MVWEDFIGGRIYKESCLATPSPNWPNSTGKYGKAQSNILYFSAAFRQPLASFLALLRNVDDIDLYPGGISEIPQYGALIGPTFACLVGKQYRNLRYGDRFWYENSGMPSSFTPCKYYHSDLTCIM